MASGTVQRLLSTKGGCQSVSPPGARFAQQKEDPSRRCEPFTSSASLLLSSLELSDTQSLYAPYIRARLGITAHFSSRSPPTNPHGWTKSMVFRPRIYLVAPLDSDSLSIYSTNLFHGVNIPIFGNWQGRASPFMAPGGHGHGTYKIWL